MYVHLCRGNVGIGYLLNLKVSVKLQCGLITEIIAFYFLTINLIATRVKENE